jgi:hypothetical protein
MRATFTLLAMFVLHLGGPAPVQAQSQAAREEAGRIVLDVQKGTRLQRTMGAIAMRHFAGRQGSFRLLGHPELRWWQAAFAPAGPRLVQMLGDDSGLEWVDGAGMPEASTTPHKEAAQALVSLQRAAIEPLLARLDDPRIGPRAAEVLLQIVPTGPTSAAAWPGWWAEHRNDLLPSEHGQLVGLTLKVLVLALGVAGVVLAQIWRARRAEAARR